MSPLFASLVAVSDSDVFDERDVTDWRVIGDEVLGTKPKRWLVPDDNSHEAIWLMKDRTFSRSDKFGRYPKGDDWSERIAAAVATSMGIPAAHVELATKRKESGTEILGVISKRIHDEDESLVHGNELLEDYRGTADAWDMTGYSLHAINKALDDVGPPPGTGWNTAWELFVGYLLLDAIIGNTDRHPENWAAIDAGDSSSRTLAPSFDHASCLGFQLSAADKQQRLSSRDQNLHPESWASNAKTHFEGKPTTTQAAIESIGTLAAASRRNLLNRIPTQNQLDDLVDAVPDSRMAEVDREFAKRMLRANVQRLTAMSH